MSLEIRRNSDGTIRRVWYGRYEINGHRHCLNLGVKIAGNPPASLSLRDPGDIVFERSRATAFAKLVNFTEEARVKHNQEHILEKLYEHKVGEPIRSVLIGDLPQKWQPSKQPAAKRYIRQARSTLARFTKHIETQYPRVTEITDVNRDMARSFMEAEGSRAITNKTWNDILILLRAAFKSLLPPGGINPFSEFKRRPTDTIFRVPFTANELNAIEEATQQDAFIRPVVITGICTAMREGDCCLLKWRSVDLERRFITVKTLKTGTTVTIPIFPLLLRELSERAQTHEYVFPDQAAMYLTNPDGITWRFRKILKAAGFKDNATDGNISGPIATGKRHPLSVPRQSPRPKPSEPLSQSWWWSGCGTQILIILALIWYAFFHLETQTSNTQGKDQTATRPTQASSASSQPYDTIEIPSLGKAITPAQLRVGKSTGNPTDGEQSIYFNKKEFFVVIGLTEGICSSKAYAPNGNHTPMDDRVLKVLLSANSGTLSWHYDERASQISLTPTWNREDGLAYACFDPKSQMLTIALTSEAKEYIKTSKRLRGY